MTGPDNADEIWSMMKLEEEEEERRRGEEKKRERVAEAAFGLAELEVEAKGRARAGGWMAGR